MENILYLNTNVNRPAQEVYDFVSNPRNLTKWAAGLTQSEVVPEGNEWAAKAPFGKIWITFAEINNLGVVDHDVRTEDGQVFHNPMRIIPVGKGCNIVFTLIRQPGMSDEKMEEDKKAISNDLETLKTILEKDIPLNDPRGY